MTGCGPRDIWQEIQDTAARWNKAGSPSAYRLHLDPDGTQWVSAGTGTAELSWPLPSVPKQTPHPSHGLHPGRHAPKEAKEATL